MLPGYEPGGRRFEALTMPEREYSMVMPDRIYIAGLYAIRIPGRIFGNANDGYILVPQGSALPK